MGVLRPILRPVMRSIMSPLMRKYSGGVPFPTDLAGQYTRTGLTFTDTEGNDGAFLPVIASVDLTSELQFTDLSGVAVTSSDGTSTPSVVGNSVTFTVGTCSNLLLDDGTQVPNVQNGYDISAAANHGTVVNITKTYSSVGSTHAADNGYSLWQDAGNPDIQVPYGLDGLPLALTPGTDIPAGYTKTVDIVGAASTWNMADCLVDFDPSGATPAVLDILDRSNATIQTSTSRASLYYDANHPYRYHITELADFAILDTFFEALSQDREFAHVIYSGATIISLVEFLNYVSVKTGVDLATVKSYCNIP